ncbi:MAG: hypothetical protein AAFY21_19210 [Cyanobacteria bacterium J06641_2]
MKNLLRNSLIASVVAVAGVVSGAGVSFAGSATLNLNANIPKSCEFDQSNYSNSSPKITQERGIDVSFIWGGTFTVSCNHGGQVTITVDSVTELGQVAATQRQRSFRGELFQVNDGSKIQILYANGARASSPQPYNTGELGYKFLLETNPDFSNGETGLVPGDYGYTIQMTATPN